MLASAPRLVTPDGLGLQSNIMYGALLLLSGRDETL